MLRDEELQRAISALPFLRGAPVELMRDFAAEASFSCLPAGVQIFAEGDECSIMAVVKRQRAGVQTG